MISNVKHEYIQKKDDVQGKKCQDKSWRERDTVEIRLGRKKEGTDKDGGETLFIKQKKYQYL